MRLLFLADVSADAHVGDEAMLEANIGLCRRLVAGACEIQVASGPGWQGDRLGVQAVSRLEFPRDSEPEREALLEALRGGADAEQPAVRAVLACDRLIISGGGNLSSSWPHYLYERLALARLAASRGIPVVMLGQTLGPEFRPRERELVAELLRIASWVGVRETYSYALALELGVEEKKLSYQLDDAAFLEPEPVPEGDLGVLGLSVQRPWIAITVHPIGEPSVQNPVVSKLASAFRSIGQATGADLVFVPHVRFAQQGDTVDDGVFGEAISRALYGNPPIILAPVLPAAQTLWLTQQAALVISTRYHPLVFALAGGVPAVGLWCDEYTRRKLQGVMIHAGIPNDAMALDAAITGGLVRKAMDLWDLRALQTETRQQRISAWRQREIARGTELKTLLLGNREATLTSVISMKPVYSPEQILEKVASVPNWYHRIELAPGLITPGINDTANYFRLFNFPEDCSGMRVLDIGTRDGYFAFEFEKRGAEVLALDYVPAERTGFAVAAEVLGSKVVHRQKNIYEICREELGSFDIILMLGLLYHLPDPMLALDLCRKICHGRFYLETQVIDRAFQKADGTFGSLSTDHPELANIPIMQFYPRDALNQDYTNYWAPNEACMKAMLEENRFTVDRIVSNGPRGVFECQVGTDRELEYFNSLSRGLA